MRRLRTQYPATLIFDFQFVVGQLYPDFNQYWIIVKLAESDMTIQIFAPSVYMDGHFAKEGRVAAAASTLDAMGWHNIGFSRRLSSYRRILAAAILVDLRDTIEFLRNKAPIVAPKKITSLLRPLRPQRVLYKCQWLKYRNAIDP